MNEVYQVQILDDLHHLTHSHGGQIQNILENGMKNYGYKQCNVDDCDFAWIFI